MTHSLDKYDEDVKSTPEEEYKVLLRSLRRRKGFGLVFVRCTPVGGLELIEKIHADLPQKKADVLELKEPIDNLIDLVKAFPNQENLNILYVVGLEKSLVEYIRPGYGGSGDYYNLDTVPPILSHLNWQRENFRDKFRHLCFVFLLPRFAIKYILRRAPDFFDWGSGTVDFPTDKELVAQESQRIVLDGDFQKYRSWTSQERTHRIIEIEELITEPYQNQDRKVELLFEQGNILSADERYEEAIASYDKAVGIKPNYHEAWISRGLNLIRLGRYEKGIVSLFQALQIKPDEEILWDGIEALLPVVKEEFKSSGKTESIPLVIQAYKNGIKILEQTGDRKRMVKFSYQLGKALLELGNYTEAIENLQACEQISQQLNDIPALALTLFDLARLYHLIGRLEQSRLYFKDSLRLFRRLQDLEKSAAVTLALGNLEMQIGKFSQAETHLKEAESYYKDRDNSERLEEINYLLQILEAA
jgi:tetratricopeptide (TPR) repeat protein